MPPYGLPSRIPVPSRSGTLILLRHGQSIWNVTDPSTGTISRFTGWADIPLTPLGADQARAAGRALRDSGLGPPDAAYCSLLARSVGTCDTILRECGLREAGHWENIADAAAPLPSPYKIPVMYSWRLNERHYGGLVGLSKAETERKYSADLLHRWRHGWDTAPPPMDEDMRLYWEKHAGWCRTVTHLTSPHHRTRSVAEGRERRWRADGGHRAGTQMPPAESLGDCARRALPVWTESVAPRLRRGENVLVVAHANTIKSVLYHVDPEHVTRDNMKQVAIPSAVPLVYKFRSAEGAEKDAEEVLPGNLLRVGGGENDSNFGGVPLGGRWMGTDETKNLSFCTKEGRKLALEHEIA